MLQFCNLRSDGLRLSTDHHVPREAFSSCSAFASTSWREPSKELPSDVDQDSHPPLQIHHRLQLDQIRLAVIAPVRRAALQQPFEIACSRLAILFSRLLNCLPNYLSLQFCWSLGNFAKLRFQLWDFCIVANWRQI